MRVRWEGEGGAVWFDLCSIAKGRGLVGRLAFPLNRGMQVRDESPADVLDAGGVRGLTANNSPGVLHA
jgi:hypothetical protein